MEIKEKIHENVVLLHCHIFKNGGSSIDSALLQNFGTKAIFRESPAGQQFLLSDAILDIVESTGPKKVASISSHRMGLPAPSHDTITFIPLIMIREPLDRLGSMYSFYRSQKVNISHECLLAKRETLKSFVEILLSAGLDSSFSNLQSQFFLGNYFPPKHPSEKTWPTIVENLNAVPCVGLLEMFDESMVIWEDFVGQFIPTIDFSYIKSNVSANRSSSLAERLELLHDQLGDGLISEFKQRNHYDYRLYNLAKAKLQQTINSHSSFPERLANFKKRISLGPDQSIQAKDQLPDTKGKIENKNQTNTMIVVPRGKKQILLNRPPTETKGVDSSPIHIIGCGLFEQETGTHLQTVRHGQQVEVLVAVEVKGEIPAPIVGITVSNDNQDIVFAMNSLYSTGGVTALSVGKDMKFSFLFTMPPLNSGSYTISPAVASGTQEEHTLLSTVKDAVLFFVPKMIGLRMPGFLYLNEYSLQSQLTVL